jgi:SAM-dependent methyltransferase
MSDKSFSFSGENASNYDAWLGPLMFEPSALEFLKYIGSSEQQSVLEIAAGTGRLTSHLRKYFPQTTRLVATDLSPDMLEMAREILKDFHIEFQLADAQDLPFPDHCFDLALCQFGLMFLPDKRKGFAEAYRILKPGGRFIFSTWDSQHNIPLLDLVFNRVIIPFFKGEDSSRFQVPFSMHDPAMMMNSLHDSGFRSPCVMPIAFKGYSPSPEYIVNAYLLKHPLSKEVAARDASALPGIAAKMHEMISSEFGTKDIVFDLKAFIGMGEK